MNHCVNCIYFVPSPDLPNNPAYGKCLKTKRGQEFSEQYCDWMVTGQGNKPEHAEKMDYCTTARRGIMETDCGPEGKFFEARTKQ